MKKVLGVIIVIAALAFAAVEFCSTTVAEEIALQEINRELDSIHIESVIETETTEETEAIISEEEIVEETIIETVPEIHSFDWIEDCTFGETLGKVTIYHDEFDDNGNFVERKEILSTPLGFGGSTNASIDGKAGLHEQLSNVDELFILGHHYQNGTCFGKLKKAVEGDIVEVKTFYGTFLFEVTDSRYVTEQEYAEDNYAVCTNGKDTLTLATCETQNVKGRRIVVCELIDIVNN